MSENIKLTTLILCCFGTTLPIHSQGYIVPNGVVTSYISGEISVMYNPPDLYYTGFSLNAVSANTFQFDPVLDVGVRVFLVSPGQPVSLNPILAMGYPEFTYPNSYIFNAGVPVYVGLYTGNVQSAPPNGIYNDPLFGWAELENISGTIELLNSALEYQGGGIYAGTQTIIPIPEPATWALTLCGATLVGLSRWKRT